MPPEKCKAAKRLGHVGVAGIAPRSLLDPPGRFPVTHATNLQTHKRPENRMQLLC
jgi:hypothetical protein